MAALGISGYLGFSLNQVNAATPIIIHTLAISDCVHLFNSYFNERAPTGFDMISYSLNSGSTNGVNNSYTDIIKRLNKNMHGDNRINGYSICRYT